MGQMRGEQGETVTEGIRGFASIKAEGSIDAPDCNKCRSFVTVNYINWTATFSIWYIILDAAYEESVAFVQGATEGN